MHRRRVLVADADPGLRRLICVTLGSTDFELLQAADGEDALRIVRQQLPELVLLEVNIPKLDGFELCRQIRAQPETASIRVFMLTERATDKDQARGRDAGADAYFTKPFSPLQLLNEIYALLA